MKKASVLFSLLSIVIVISRISGMTSNVECIEGERLQAQLFQEVDLATERIITFLKVSAYDDSKKSEVISAREKVRGEMARCFEDMKCQESEILENAREKLQEAIRGFLETIKKIEQEACDNVGIIR